jgi:hypothetical protein
MTPADFTIEKTIFGLQYVIPGMERIRKSKQPVFEADKTPAGDQLVIPGAETISTKEYLVRLAGKPLLPRRGQIGLQGTELFRRER